jgi:hypothetical protein
MTTIRFKAKRKRFEKREREVVDDSFSLFFLLAFPSFILHGKLSKSKDVYPELFFTFPIKNALSQNNFSLSLSLASHHGTPVFFC